MNKFFVLIGMLFITTAGMLFSQASPTPSTNPSVSPSPAATSAPPEDPPIKFGMSMEIGFTTLPSADNGPVAGWQRVMFSPDIGIGKFGIGLNLDFNFRFNGGADGSQFEINPDDWIPSSRRSFADIYFSKFSYIRYGTKGEDIFFLIGNLNGSTLGNGFIVNGYKNTMYMPAQRIVGVNFDLDGKAFNFPYLGVETMVANLARVEFGAARLYLRPIQVKGVEFLQDLQIGMTIATDANPHAFNTDTTIKKNVNKDRVTIFGTDLRIPIVNEDMFTLALFGDIAWQNWHSGGQVGLGGKLLGLFKYMGAIRFMGENYLPDYFDAAYDLYREEKFAVYNGNAYSPAYNGWLAKLDLVVLEEIFTFGILVDGPFWSANPGFDNPNLRASLALKEGVIGDLSLLAWYEKRDIGHIREFITPENAIIGAKAGYRFGPAVVALIYDIRYDPYSKRTDSDGRIQKWLVNSRLETVISITGGDK